MSVTYRQAGVDLRGAERWLARLAPSIRSTHTRDVLADLGAFAGLLRLPARGLRDPVLVASADGVGTKLAVAQLTGQHEAIGLDVVAMNVNDVLAYGARPLFFLDYLAVGRLQPAAMSGVLRGIVRGCRLSGCALLGGETAEMPGLYRRGEYDIAGFCVGLADRARLVDGSTVRAGDVVVGLASSGVHANGFSLIRRALTRRQLRGLGRRLMAPTRIYVRPVLRAIAQGRVRAIAHITGGGLARRLPSLVRRRPGLVVELTPASWRVPEIFEVIERAGRISRREMLQTFNMGIGMALVCRPTDAARLMRRMRVPAWRIGTIQRA